MTSETELALVDANDPHALLAHKAAPEIAANRLDEEGVYVISKLRQAGHEAYFVGGCVRDWLIGRTPKDFDIATSATPNQVRSRFRNCRLIGRRFRLAHIYFKDGKILEVSTFRAMPAQEAAVADEAVSEPTEDVSSVEQLDVSGSEPLLNIDESGSFGNVNEEASDESKHFQSNDGLATPEPFETNDSGAEKDLLIIEDNTFGTALEDARRRDFTINGLFYDPTQGVVIDYVNGLKDLAEREIRTIGDPEQRMREDPVRILRAIRFSAKLEFEIEPGTYAAMEGAVEDLPRCAAPRLLEETFRLLRGGTAATALRLVVALDAMQFLVAPVHQHLRETNSSEAYFAFIAAMDSLVLAGAEFDDSMLLAVALLPLAVVEFEKWRAAPENQNNGGDERMVMSQSVEALLRGLVQKARLPRRMAERCRMILLSQRTLAGWRRRRGGLSGFRSHPLFRESLRVFEVWSMATGTHTAALEAWKSGRAPTPAPDAPGPRRRKRKSGPSPKPTTSEGAPSAPLVVENSAENELAPSADPLENQRISEPDAQ